MFGQYKKADNINRADIQTLNIKSNYKYPVSLLIDIDIALPAEEGDHLGDDPVPQPLVARHDGNKGHCIASICKDQ